MFLGKTHPCHVERSDFSVLHQHGKSPSPTATGEILQRFALQNDKRVGKIFKETIPCIGDIA